MIIPYLPDPLLMILIILNDTKLILIYFLIQINIYQYLTVTYQYFVNAYVVKVTVNQS